MVLDLVLEYVCIVSPQSLKDSESRVCCSAEYREPVFRKLESDGRVKASLTVPPARWAISSNHVGDFILFLDLARAQRGLFRRCSPQGAPNGPPSSCSAHCRARGGCRPSATAEVWLRRASVRPPA